jgi:uncharacterized membrane protein
LTRLFRKAETVAKSQLIVPDRFDQLLSLGAAILLAALIIAIFKGRADWSETPASVWFHLVTIATALVLTPIMLLRQRGDKWHKQTGYIWVIAMFVTAMVSIDIRLINRGGFSIIHLLSVWTIIQCTLILWSARKRNTVRHRSAVRGMVFGALLIAGFFTFPFDRLLGRWLFS